MRLAACRKIVKPKKVKSLRALMRRHLRLEGKQIRDLAPVWQITVASAHRRFYDGDRRMCVQYVDAFIDFLKLDEFDALELRRIGAIEAGWQIDKGYTL